MKLNGWYRLWIVLTGIWLILWTALGVLVLVVGQIDRDMWIGSTITIVCVPLAVLGLGHAVSWILRGFRKS
jgi:hypothetical protein